MDRVRRWVALVALSFFAAGAATHQVLFSRLLGLSKLLSYYPLQVLSNTVEVLLAVCGISVAHGRGARPLRELGLQAPFGRALAFALIATLPMSLGFALGTGFGFRFSLAAVAVGCLIAPFAEEVLFRGFIFRQLYRRAGWGFWPAAITPSGLFALLHVYQARSLGELLGILGITGVGSILFCWVYLRWQDNLWAPIAVHVAMNLWWELFAVAETALGGWFANAARLATVLLGVLLTVFKDRIWPLLPQEVAHVAAAGRPTDRGSAGSGAVQRAGVVLGARTAQPAAAG
jgi:membrane protease YdiL (CAAX protease family)